LTDLGSLSAGSFSGASGINDAGQVTGSAAINSVPVSRAFLYSNGRMKDLGTLGGSGSYGTASIMPGK
jgi:probable HAF family extracellular repeat protein